VKREHIRLGKVEYLNTIPVYYAWEKGLVHTNGVNVEIKTGTPSELNQQLSQGDLDISVVSCVEYAIHHRDYLLLPDLCIGAVDEVKSVLFFSQKPLNELEDTEVWITRSSLTSSTLVRFILEEDIGISPNYRLFTLGNRKDCSPEAMLLIGDEALRERKRKRYPYVLDLARYWREKHGLPFVFAVWCVRREVWQEQPQGVAEVSRTLLASRDMGRLLMDEIATLYHEQVGLSHHECLDYLKGLSFHLTEQHVEGMKLFFKLLTERKLVPEEPKVRFVEIPPGDSNG